MKRYIGYLSLVSAVVTATGAVAIDELAAANQEQTAKVTEIVDLVEAFSEDCEVETTATGLLKSTRGELYTRFATRSTR